LHHAAVSLEGINQTAVLPIVVIRDPFFWMQRCVQVVTGNRPGCEATTCAPPTCKARSSHTAIMFKHSEWTYYLTN
jgi:hypothetical protein